MLSHSAILCSLYISKLCKSVCCVGIEIVSIKVIYHVQSTKDITLATRINLQSYNGYLRNSWSF